MYSIIDYYSFPVQSIVNIRLEESLHSRGLNVGAEAAHILEEVFNFTVESMMQLFLLRGYKKLVLHLLIFQWRNTKTQSLQLIMETIQPIRGKWSYAIITKSFSCIKNQQTLSGWKNTCLHSAHLEISQLRSAGLRKHQPTQANRFN